MFAPFTRRFFSPVNSSQYGGPGATPVVHKGLDLTIQPSPEVTSDAIDRLFGLTQIPDPFRDFAVSMGQHNRRTGVARMMFSYGPFTNLPSRLTPTAQKRQRLARHATRRGMK